jgi:hypothetical protein
MDLTTIPYLYIKIITFRKWLVFRIEVEMILWRMEPLLGKVLEANSEYGHCYAIGNKLPFLSDGLVNTFPRKRYPGYR